MFVRHATAAAAATLTILVDGREVQVPAGVSVAAALLGAGAVVLGASPVSGRPRGPWCLMGTCFGCLVEIDGVPDERACAVTVRDAMRIVLTPAAAAPAPACDPWGPGA